MSMYRLPSGFLITMIRDVKMLRVDFSYAQATALDITATSGWFRATAGKLEFRLTRLSPGLLERLRQQAAALAGPEPLPLDTAGDDDHYMMMELIPTEGQLREHLAKVFLPNLVLGENAAIADVMADHFQQAADEIVAEAVAELDRRMA